MAEHADDEKKLMSAEMTLATIREYATRDTGPAFSEHSRGYHAALRDVLAILDARYLPEGAPVNLPGRP